MAVPSNAPPGSVGAQPLASGLATSDYFLGWQPNVFPASSVLVQNSQFIGLDHSTAPVTAQGSSASGTLAFWTGMLAGSVSGAIIASGTINNTAIGGTTPAAGAFTTLSASSMVSGAGFTSLFASPPPIGSTTPAAGAFTTLGATGTTTLGNGSANYLTIAGAASGSGPMITAAGSDANIFVRALPKGSGKFEALRASFGTANGSASLFDGTTPLYVENNPTFSGSLWGNSAQIVTYLGGTTTTTGQPQVVLFQVAGDSLEATAANSIAYTAIYGTFGATQASRIGLDISIQTTAALNDAPGNGNFHQGISTNMNTSFPLGGTAISYGGNWLGGFFQSSLSTGAQYVNSLGGVEIDIGAATGTSVAFKHALSVVLLSSDAVDSSSGPSTGLMIDLQATATGNTASPGFMYGIAFGGKEGWWPINTTSGTMIMADPNRLNNGSSSGPAIAAATGIDFSAVTFSTAFLKSKGFLVDGSGNTTIDTLAMTGQTINLPNGTTNIVTTSNNGDLRVAVVNNYVGTSVSASREFSTGTGNSYTLDTLHDNNGAPYLQHSMGPSVTGVYYDAPLHVFRNVAATSILSLNTSEITCSTLLGLNSYTVATLPAAPATGSTAYVTDATSPTFLGTLTGGGSVKCPVFYNGTAWVAG